MKHLLFVFLDGVGLGPDESDNPLFQHGGPHFRRLAGDQSWTRPFTTHCSQTQVVRPLDATLGVEGLPQSGTGQATLFTGINCARLVGRHFGPYPHSKTYEAIDESNVFTQLRSGANDGPYPVAFANAYPPQFFRRDRRRETVTTRCCRAANVLIRGIDELRNRRALSADLTGDAWRDQLELDVPVLDSREAAQSLTALARAHRFTLFEYFLTDKVGHRRIDVPASDVLARLDEFLGTVLDEMDPEEDALMITSDHGNMEDATHTQHTRNEVPLIVHGWAAPYFANAESLTDVTPAILQALTGRTDAEPSSSGA